MMTSESLKAQGKSIKREVSYGDVRPHRVV